MAQDFRAAFGLGSDDKTITQVDVNGVALAAIQGLNAKLEAKVAEQARELADLRERQMIEAAARDKQIAALQHTVELLLARQAVETAYAEHR
jgi:hypothetical protein